MKKTKNIINIIKDILIKSCIYFTVMTLLLTSAAYMIAQDIFAPGTCFMFALAALGAGIAVQVFKITRIPVFSRHLAFFILLYIDFFLVLVAMRKYTASASTPFFLSIYFIIIYFVIFGIVMGIKAAVNASENKKLKYEKQFKNINTDNTDNTNSEDNNDE